MNRDIGIEDIEKEYWMQVSVGNIFAALQGYGASQRGIANAAMNTPAGGSEYSFLYTVMKGGKDQNGYFKAIDTNGDRFISNGEWMRLASADGDSTTFSSKDFETLFPKQAQSRQVDTLASFGQLDGIAGTNYLSDAQAQINQQFGPIPRPR